MWTWLKHFGLTLLFDEAAGPRLLGVGLVYIGNVIQTGGAVPGTPLALPLLSNIYWLGPYVWMLGLAILGTHGTFFKTVSEAASAARETKRTSRPTHGAPRGQRPR